MYYSYILTLPPSPIIECRGCGYSLLFLLSIGINKMSLIFMKTTYY